MSTISPSNPSSRSVSAALAPARLAPTMTNVGMGLRLRRWAQATTLGLRRRRAGHAEAVMPGDRRGIGEGSDLVDDDAAAGGVGRRLVPGRAQQRVKRH